LRPNGLELSCVATFQRAGIVFLNLKSCFVKDVACSFLYTCKLGAPAVATSA
jgi:hypothetical protein